MPIEISDPPAGANLGPGIRVAVFVPGSPTLPAGTRWRVSVSDADTPEATFYQEEFEYSGNDGWAFGFAGGTGRWVQPMSGTFPHGSAARMLVELIGEGVTEPSLSQAVTWDTVTGMPYVVGVQSGDGGGGLTPEQAAQLDETHEATIVQMGVPANPIDVPIGSLIAHPPLGILEIDAAAVGATGDGAFGGTLAGGEPIYGLWWEFTTVPPELGVQFGLTEHFHQRMVQFRTIHTVGGVELVSEVLEADYQRVVWLFETAFPTRIEYRVLPGVSVNIHGLNARFGPD